MKAFTQQLNKIEERANAATSGPWQVRGDGYWSVIGQSTFSVISASCDLEGDHELITREKNSLENAKFIAHARTDIPKLIEYLKIATEALEKLADPRKRDHTEPDKYTEVGCMINIAQEALDKLGNE